MKKYIHSRHIFCNFAIMILIADDDKTVLMSLRLMLERKGYEVVTATSREEAMTVIRAREPQLILMDMNYSLSTSGEEGLILLRQAKIFRPDTPIILMTAWGSIPLAVKGMQAGAIDFITKPWDNTTLLSRIKTTLKLSGKASEDNDENRKASTFDRSNIIGRSPALLRVLDTIERVAETDAPILIMGENGTGKELIAEAIHKNSSRKNNPFVKVNLGGIAQSLFESEMFGHKKGAFTGATSDRKGRFELADRGTIFLDEIGDLDPACQVKLLRVLQEQTFEPLGDSHTRRVNIRVVCATNADLPAMVAQKQFREDLFYRINLITVTLPPLRERRDDIPLLVKHFAAGYKDVHFTDDAIRYLSSLPYPGNIRELKNLVERTLLVGSKDGNFTADHFKSQYDGAKSLSPNATVPATEHGMTLEDIERHAITEAIRQCGGNLSRVALTLGITRQSLYRRMEKHGIDL